MSSKRTTGQIFRDARLKKGWTQVQVAKRAGIHSNTLAKVERDEQQPEFDTIQRLAKVLSVSLSDLPSK